MAAITSKRGEEACRRVQAYAEEVADDEQFISDVTHLVRCVQDETELALMRGATPHLGEKHMLLSAIYQAISLTNRPVHREAAFAEVKAALDKYLGVKFPPKGMKKRRRGLLPHV